MFSLMIRRKYSEPASSAKRSRTSRAAKPRAVASVIGATGFLRTKQRFRSGSSGAYARRPSRRSEKRPLNALQSAHEKAPGGPHTFCRRPASERPKSEFRWKR